MEFNLVFHLTCCSIRQDSQFSFVPLQTQQALSPATVFFIKVELNRLSVFYFPQVGRRLRASSIYLACSVPSGQHWR